ncbi:phosphatase [Halobacteriales archaeon QS_8_69_26]|nr:MAG: phosphatase [Halobacteriales archaeon QS_8_69_26]
MTTDGNDSDDGSPVVRPLGYVEDWAVVRRIGDRDLFLGNHLAADPSAHDRSFDHVLSATREPRPLTTHHHPLDDGPDNEWSDFAAAVDAARDLYRREGSSLIHCKAGISRSTTLAATAVAAEEGTDFRAGLEEVQAARPAAIPHPALHQSAVVYLAARS